MVEFYGKCRQIYQSHGSHGPWYIATLCELIPRHIFPGAKVLSARLVLPGQHWCKVCVWTWGHWLWKVGTHLILDVNCSQWRWIMLVSMDIYIYIFIVAEDRMHCVLLAPFICSSHTQSQSANNLNIGRIRRSRYLLLQRIVRCSFRSFVFTLRFADGSFGRDDVGELLPLAVSGCQLR